MVPEMVRGAGGVKYIRIPNKNSREDVPALRKL